MKTALLFGATGLVGKELFKRLSADPHYSQLKVFVRRRMMIKLLNVEVVEMNFEKLNESASQISGDDCFCALGTTMRNAGSQEAFHKIDFDLVVDIAKLAKQNGVKRFIVVSSIGADASSSNFYLRTKGEMEEALKQLSFEHLAIVRPSILLGKRNEFRLGERIGIFFARILSPLMLGPLKKYRAIQAKTVARAMIQLANSSPRKNIYESPELFDLAK